MPRIVVALPERDNEFQRLQEAEARAVAARHGIEVQILDGEGSPVLQVQQLFRQIHLPEGERPQGMVVEPVAEKGLERIAQAATAAGIPWAALNWGSAVMEELRQRHPRLPIFTVSSDQVDIGRIQGRQFRLALPRGGRALHIQGPPTSQAAQARCRGLVEAIEGAQIELIQLEAQWTEESAEKAVKGWLRLKTSEASHIGLVAGQDDSMARGARKALETQPNWEAAWAHLPYLGIDGVPEVGQRLVNEGQLTATVVMPSNTGPAVDLIAQFLRSGTVPPPSVVLSAGSYPDEVELRQRLSERTRPS
jgi:ribose transport system substrate-binding protein